MAVEQVSQILVVEDEALIMMATVDMLRELGHETITARCAAAALAASDRMPALAAMVTDVNLPDTDGQMLAAEMRRRRPGLPIVFATGYRIAIASVVGKWRADGDSQQAVRGERAGGCAAPGPSSERRAGALAGLWLARAGLIPCRPVVFDYPPEISMTLDFSLHRGPALQGRREPGL